MGLSEICIGVHVDYSKILYIFIASFIFKAREDIVELTVFLHKEYWLILSLKKDLMK